MPEALRVAGLGSNDAYCEPHSVKVLMSRNTAKPPESEREYSTCRSRPLKSVRMMSPVSLHFTQMLTEHLSPSARKQTHR